MATKSKSFESAVILTALVFVAVLVSSTSLLTGSVVLNRASALSPNLIVSDLKIWPVASSNPFVVEVPAGSNSKKLNPPTIAFTHSVKNIGRSATRIITLTKITETFPDGSVQSYGDYGADPLAPGQTSLFYDGSPNGYQPLQTRIAVGADVAGWHTLMACADDGNAIRESNENDNCKAITFLVKVV